MFDLFFRAQLIALIFIPKFPLGDQKASKPLPKKVKIIFSNQKNARASTPLRSTLFFFFLRKKGP